MTDIDPALLDLIREATKAAVEAALRRRMPTITPGTVEQFDPATQLCSVLIDGDTVAIPGIPNGSGSWPFIGQRVMVKFSPPQGIEVAAVHSPLGFPSIQVNGRNTPEPLVGGTAEPLPFDVIEGGGDQSMFEVVAAPVNGVAAIKVHLSARYRALAHVSHTTGAAGRRFIGYAINEVAATPGGVLDIQTGAAGVFVGTAARPVWLDAEDIIQVRSLASVAVNATLESFSLEWMGPYPA